MKCWMGWLAWFDDSTFITSLCGLLNTHSYTSPYIMKISYKKTTQLKMSKISKQESLQRRYTDGKYMWKGTSFYKTVLKNNNKKLFYT